MLDPKHVSPDVIALNPDVFPERGTAQPRTAEPSRLEEKFLRLWQEAGGPDLVREYRFHPDRRWRFDFAHVASHTAYEVEGGVHSQGRHTRGAGFTADAEKYNAAALAGWRVFRFTGPMIKDEPITNLTPVVIIARANPQIAKRLEAN